MSMLRAEQTIKGIMLRGMSLTLDAKGKVKISGFTRNLTDGLRYDVGRYKPEVVHYLTESPIVIPALYVATDLEHWTTDEPHLWADKVIINKKAFLRLTPSVLLWLKAQVLKTEAACTNNKISLEQLRAIICAFTPVYEYAVRVGMVADPAKKVNDSTRSPSRGHTEAAA